MMGLASTLLVLSTASSEPVPFVKEGMEDLQKDDGYIALPVAPKKLKELAEKLKTLKYDRQRPFGNEGDGVLAIAVHLAERFGGKTQTIKIEGGEGERPDNYTITYTDMGYLDDETRGQRYQYVVKAETAEEGGGLTLVKAKAWVMPWPDRYAGVKEWYKKNKRMWGQ